MEKGESERDRKKERDGKGRVRETEKREVSRIIYPSQSVGAQFAEIARDIDISPAC